MNSSQLSDVEGNQAESTVRSDHDIRASMAIANGFGSALDASFSELLESYNSLVASLPDGVSEPQLEKLKQTEQDCKYCLARLIHSIDLLKSRLSQADYLSGVKDGLPPQEGKSS